MSATPPLDDHAVFDLFPDVMIDRDNIEHYRALAGGRLLINQCKDCGLWVYPHRPLCPKCMSWNVMPTEVSGKGKVFMYTLLQQLRDPNGFLAEPVVVAAVELIEQRGMRYLARIVNCPRQKLALDMPVVLTWVKEHNRLAPAFEPVADERIRAGG